MLYVDTDFRKGIPVGQYIALGLRERGLAIVDSCAESIRCSFRIVQFIVQSNEGNEHQVCNCSKQLISLFLAGEHSTVLYYTSLRVQRTR